MFWGSQPQNNQQTTVVPDGTTPGIYVILEAQME